MTAQAEMSTDRIEKHAVLRAPRERVWRALTTAAEFGTWFGVKFDGEFAPGAWIKGKLTIPRYAHMTLEVQIERIEPQHHFSYRWHPYAVDPEKDYSTETMTLVEFTLQDTDGGTALTVVESGFDRLPLERRAEAFRMNDHGWIGQIKNLERYVA